MVTIQELMKELSPREYIIIDKKENLVVVCDRVALTRHGEERTKRIYLIKEGDLLEEFDVNGAIQDLVKSLGDKVKLQSILKDVLKTSVPADLVEALKRVKAERKVEVGKGCVSLLIRGGKGQRPVEFAIGRR